MPFVPRVRHEQMDGRFPQIEEGSSKQSGQENRRVAQANPTPSTTRIEGYQRGDLHCFDSVSGRTRSFNAREQVPQAAARWFRGLRVRNVGGYAKLDLGARVPFAPDAELATESGGSLAHAW